MKKLGYLSAILLTLTVILLFVGGNRLTHIFHRYTPFIAENPTQKVLSYREAIETELKKYNMLQFTPVLLAIMYQESRGEGSDPMQASESAGLKRNEIQNSKQSVEQGVFHFQEMYKIGQKQGVDLTTIIQSYNMGPGYIKYVAENGKKHTEDLAKNYSKMQVDAHPGLYTCGGLKGNFRYPYCFGDFTYNGKVQKKIKLMEEQLLILKKENKNA